MKNRYGVSSLLLTVVLAMSPVLASAQMLTATRTSTVLTGPPECTVNTCIEIVAAGENPNQLCLVNILDASSSMVDESTDLPDGTNRYDRTKAALNLIVEGIGDVVAPGSPEFGLVTFGTEASIVVDPTTNDTASYKATVSGLPDPVGTQLTYTRAAIDSAATFSCPDGAEKVMLLSSDGVPTYRVVGIPNLTPPPDSVFFNGPCDVSPTSPNDCTSQAIAAADTAKSEGWTIVTVGIGLDSLDATDALGLATLDSISSGLSFNVPTPADAGPVVDALIDLLGGTATANVVLDDTLTTCWDFVPSSTTGDLGADDPALGAGFVTYDVGTLVSPSTIEVCYDMAYDVSTCGNVVTPIDFNGGLVTYDNTGAIGLTNDVPSSGPIDMSECLTTLPVELVEFTALAEDQSVVLNWSTASELNNAGFEVEHAVAEGFFEVAGFVEGHGSTNDVKQYTFSVDALEPGLHKFRLKQVDFDGAFEYSGVLEVEVEVPQAYHLGEIYPNPFNPEASMRFWVSRSQHVEVTLHDVQGRQLASLYEGVPAAKASTLVRIDGSSLASGTYLVKVTGEDFTESRQVTLLK